MGEKRNRPKTEPVEHQVYGKVSVKALQRQEVGELENQQRTSAELREIRFLGIKVG